MQTSNPNVLFQTSAAVDASARNDRRSRALESRGEVINLSSKILDICVDREDLLIAESSGTARLLDVRSGAVKQIFRGHAGPVTCVAVLSPANQRWKTVFTGSWDKSVRIWRSDTGKQISILQGHVDFVKSILIIPAENILLTTSSDKCVRVWDTAKLDTGTTPHCIQTLGEHTRPVTCCTSAQKDRVWTGDSMGVIVEWRIVGGRLELNGTITAHETSITSICATEDGLWTASMDRTSCFRSWSAMDKPYIMQHTSYVSSILPLTSLATSDRLLSGCDDGRIYAWDTSDASSRQPSGMDAHTGQVSVIKPLLPPINGWGAVSGGLDQTVRRWTLDELLHPRPLVIKATPPSSARMTAEEEHELEELMD